MDNKNDDRIESERINWKDTIREHLKNNPMQVTPPNKVFYVIEDKSRSISPEIISEFLKEIKDIINDTPVSSPTVIVDRHIVKDVNFVEIPKSENTSEEFVIFSAQNPDEWVKVRKENNKNEIKNIKFENCHFPENNGLTTPDTIVSEDRTGSVPESIKKELVEEILKIREQFNPTNSIDNKNQPK